MTAKPVYSDTIEETAVLIYLDQLLQADSNERTNAVIANFLATIAPPGLNDMQLTEMPIRWFGTDIGDVTLKRYLAANEGEWITIKEAAKRLNVAIQNIHQMILSKRIRTLPNPTPPERQGVRTFVSRQDIEAIAQAALSAAAPPVPEVTATTA